MPRRASHRVIRGAGLSDAWDFLPSRPVLQGLSRARRVALGPLLVALADGLHSPMA